MPDDRSCRQPPAVLTAAFAAFAALVLAWPALADPSAGAGEPPAVELGIAPERHESQDITGWVTRPELKAGKSRAEVAALYNNTFVPLSSVALLWTGSVAGCNPGTTNLDHQQAVIARINYYRALVDLPPVSLLAGAPVTQSQAAALMMSANNALSHTPPASWLCYSADGATGAGNSNIALGASGVAAVDLFMVDSGAGNTAVGHRRWLLFPPRAQMATGDTTGSNTSTPRPANAIYVFGPSNTRPATPSGVAWPPAGFVPYQNLPAGSNRWSFSFPGANFAGATVSVTGPGGALPVTIEPLASGFGDNTIVFRPTGVDYGQPSGDAVYTVTVGGITGSGVPSSITYTVTVIDPAAVPPPVAGTVEVVEFYHAGFDHYFISSLAADIQALDSGTLKGWARTGRTFRAFAAVEAGTVPVCRFYLPPQFGDSHFYGRSEAECNEVKAKFPGFVFESPAVMYLYLPVGGVCPAGTIAVYRVFSNRTDANHRYLVERALRDQMVALGWVAEGDGPDQVVMCAPGAL